jgi:hypothetical protein
VRSEPSLQTGEHSLDVEKGLPAVERAADWDKSAESDRHPRPKKRLARQLGAQGRHRLTDTTSLWISLPSYAATVIRRAAGRAVQVVSVINFKGGVGKTTLTANLGAELARRGKRVLLLDLDPQSSLTYSFYAPDVAAGRIPPDRSIKAWYDSFDRGVPHRALGECVVAPAAMNHKIAESGGHVGLIPSTMSLIDHELSMLANVGLRGVEPGQELFRLRRALSEPFTTVRSRATTSR